MVMTAELASILTGGSQAGARPVEWRVIKKRGEALLLLPASDCAASRTLDLYPAQTGKARLLREGLRLALRCGFPLPLERYAGSVAGPFQQLATRLNGGDFPEMGVLLGNPAAPGRRFIFVLFDARGEPAWVIKAGASPEARKRLAHEARILQALPPGTMGVPHLRHFEEWDFGSAIVSPFIPGRSPNDAGGELATLMRAWIQRDEEVAIGSLESWQPLAASAAGDPRLAEFARHRAHPVLFHGDFAPWNVRAHCGAWTVIDWESAALRGVPGWDWLHFIIQRAVLVRRSSAESVVCELRELIESEPFRSYAAAAGLRGFEQQIARSYLLFCAEVLRPTEGLDRMREVQALVALSGGLGGIAHPRNG